MIRINKNLVLFSSVFFLLGTILVLVLQKFSPLLGHALYLCQVFIEAHMIPIPYYLSIIPFVFLFLILAFSSIKFLVLLLKVQFLKYKLRESTTVQASVMEIIKHLNLEEKTTIVKTDEKLAFCFGVRNPKIYVSTGLLSQLHVKELEAVLLHEQYHLENHDTFTMIIASVVHSLFPFFPVLGDLIRRYRIEREIKADNFAITNVGDASHLISALKKLLAFPTVQTVALAAIADQDTLEPRIHSLLSKPYTYRQFKIKHVLITIFSALILGSLMVTPVHAKEIHHQEQGFMMLCPQENACLATCKQEYSEGEILS